MNKTRGFTLIELLIVMVVAAILSTLAVSSYKSSIHKSRRAEATTALLEGAQQLERYYSAHGSYIDATTTNLAAVFPTQVPATGTAYYTIAVSGTPTATTFTLQATRTGDMSGDECGDFTLNQAGTQGLVNNTWSTDQCWRR